MKKILTITVWEFSQRLKDKSFQISLIVIPIIILSINFAFQFMNAPRIETTKAIGVIDHTERLFRYIEAEFKDERLGNKQPRFILVKMDKKTKRDLSDEKLLEGLIVLEDSSGRINADIISKFSLSPGEVDLIKNKLSSVIIKSEIASRYNLKLLKENIHNYSISHRFAGEEGKNRRSATTELFSGFIFVILLIVLILLSGSAFVRSLIEEKTTRIIELLLSSCSANQLLIGKLFGVSITGFFQMLVWGLIGFLFLSNDQILLETGNSFGFTILFFVLGYLLYASIFIGLGAMATSENQAQQISSILSLFLLFPVVLSTLILSSSDALLAKLMIYFPLTAAPAMLLKLNFSIVSFSEFVIPVIILIASIIIVIMLSAKLLSKELVNFEKNKKPGKR